MKMAKRGGFPGGMPGNMNNIMKQAQKMQKQMEEATKELQEKEVTSSAGGGVVEVTVSGNREFQSSVRILTGPVCEFLRCLIYVRGFRVRNSDGDFCLLFRFA